MATQADTFNNQLHETELRWFAVHARSKSEKFVQRVLAKKQIMAYLPIQRLFRRYSRSTRIVEKPLLTGYVFVKIKKTDYVPVLETEHVIGFVKFNKNLLAIPESEIDILRRITLEDDLDLEVVNQHFETGETVEISAGNLMGLKGKILQDQGKKRFLVELNYLGLSLTITIDKSFLQKNTL